MQKEASAFGSSRFLSFFDTPQSVAVVDPLVAERLDQLQISVTAVGLPFLICNIIIIMITIEVISIIARKFGWFL